MNKEEKFNKLMNDILSFREERNWKQFHNPKDLAISLTLEAGEVLEHFQWKKLEEMDSCIQENKADIGKELADTLYWVMLLSHDLEIDILDALEKKIQENAQKYPVEKSHGKHTKYTKL